MTQPANSGSLEQVLRCLQALAQSAAYSTELQAVVATMVAPFVPGVFRDSNGAVFYLTDTGQVGGASLMIDTEFGGPSTWVGRVQSTSTPGFAAVQITDNLRPLPPFPRLILSGAHGPGGLGEEREYRVWHYGVTATTITQGDADPQAVQREAIILLEALESLIERNESLGGLVDLISAEAPPQAGGYGRIKDSGILASAQTRFKVTVRRTSGL